MEMKDIDRKDIEKGRHWNFERGTLWQGETFWEVHFERGKNWKRGHWEDRKYDKLIYL